jgi:hypothetical protein
MACYQGIPERELWWSTKPIDMFECTPFRLNAFMTYSRFQEILQAIRYTDKAEPLFFLDKFHEVRQMIDAFIDHYATGYKPSWLNCINESMNSWLNKFWSGVMTLPQKPHPFGNECHTIADGEKDRKTGSRLCGV